MDEKNKYTVCTIDYCEAGCGCEYAREMHIYDHTGNRKKIFYSEEEADKAGEKAMKDRDADTYSVRRKY